MTDTDSFLAWEASMRADWLAKHPEDTQKAFND